MSDFAELKLAAEKATPGPWQRSGVRQKLDADCIMVGPDGFKIAAVPIGGPEDHAGAFCDAGFIALANPQTILSLLDQLSAAQEEIERLKGAFYADADLAREIAAERADRSTFLPPDIKRIGDLLMRAEVAGGYPENDENDAHIRRLFIADRYRFATLLAAQAEIAQLKANSVVGAASLVASYTKDKSFWGLQGK